MSAVARQSNISSRKPSIIVSEGTTGGAPRSALITTARDAAGLYENTYQLEPERALRGYQLEKIVREVLSEQLTAREYSPTLGEMTKSLADKMKQKAKALGIPRYKYVAMVVLGPVGRASAAMGSRCVWNTAFDTFGQFTFKNKTISATGIIYGMYME